jgi:signal transduction histidine kinase
MYFKHLYKQLNKKLEELSSIHDQLDLSIAKDGGDQSMRASQLKLKRVLKELKVYHQEIVKHHSSTSLFLESLFRREHFEQGQFVLHPKRCLIEQEVIKPQLENYSSRLKAAGILVETPPDMLEEEVTILADVGLLAQVYANFFSNAAKYTKEVTTPSGEKRKVMAYGREIIENFPSQGYRGIKFNVFTTGPSMSVEQGNSLFQEGMRGEGLKNQPGMGHGLSFVRQVIEMHGGIVGYEPTSEGNNFYFILPAPRPEYQPLLLTHD